MKKRKIYEIQSSTFLIMLTDMVLERQEFYVYEGPHACSFLIPGITIEFHIKVEDKSKAF